VVALYEPARLSIAARAAIKNIENVRLVSAVKAWEIADVCT
jgi:PIN domain nuclease of toxin-antitoxin system